MSAFVVCLAVGSLLMPPASDAAPSRVVASDVGDTISGNDLDNDAARADDEDDATVANKPRTPDRMGDAAAAADERNSGAMTPSPSVFHLVIPGESVSVSMLTASLFGAFFGAAVPLLVVPAMLAVSVGIFIASTAGGPMAGLLYLVAGLGACVGPPAAFLGVDAGAVTTLVWLTHGENQRALNYGLKIAIPTALASFAASQASAFVGGLALLTFITATSPRLYDPLLVNPVTAQLVPTVGSPQSLVMIAGLPVFIVTGFVVGGALAAPAAAFIAAPTEEEIEIERLTRARMDRTNDRSDNERPFGVR